MPNYSEDTQTAALALALAQKGYIDRYNLLNHFIEQLGLHHRRIGRFNSDFFCLSGYCSESLRTQGDGSNAPEPISPSQDTMTTSELISLCYKMSRNGFAFQATLFQLESLT